VASEPDDQAEPETFDPNRLGIWPTYPPGTRLPIRQVNRWLDWLGLIVVIAVLAGGGLLIWWFIATVHHR
jgi:hypothetical protein